MVYPSNSAPDGVSLLTSEGVSASVQPFELVITLVLFVVVYVLLFIGWARVVGRFVAEGPVFDKPEAANQADTDISFKGVVASDADDGRDDEPLDETEKGGDAK